MTPQLALNDGIYGCWRHSQPLRNMLLHSASSYALANIQNNRLGKLGAVMLGPPIWVKRLAVLFAFRLPAFGNLVCHIGLAVPNKKVKRVDAARIIAMVKNPLSVWNPMPEHLKRESRCNPKLSFILDSAVSLFTGRASANPSPAPIIIGGYFDFLEKAVKRSNYYHKKESRRPMKVLRARMEPQSLSGGKKHCSSFGFSRNTTNHILA